MLVDINQALAFQTHFQLDILGPPKPPETSRPIFSKRLISYNASTVEETLNPLSKLSALGYFGT